MKEYIKIINNKAIPFVDIPKLEYADFLELNTGLLENKERHCVNYFAIPVNGSSIKLICCIADDKDSSILVNSSDIEVGKTYPSLTARRLSFHLFEREINENYGVNYSDHPWMKPSRYSFDRHDKKQEISNYPFYFAYSEELHEVGVGPIHAGVIEPGHFRFICKGEQIQHLEIQLGYQHRGVEKLFLQKNFLGRAILSETISGDSTAAHASAHSRIIESLCGFRASRKLQASRALAIELERIAMHTGDLSAICADIAYQLGSAVFGRLRTPIINFTQKWTGNRFAKGLIRPGKINYQFTQELHETMIEVLNKYEPDFDEMAGEFFHNPGCLSRLEKTGVVSSSQAFEIGAVGMAAKASNLARDIRTTHADEEYKTLNHKPIVKRHGDVFSRTQIRREEIKQSLHYSRTLADKLMEPTQEIENKINSNPGSGLFGISLVEGWRGEICHCAITDESGKLLHYKIKDPSFHNWLALALSVRMNEISDFPICNKSFNLSYCGFDL